MAVYPMPKQVLRGVSNKMQTTGPIQNFELERVKTAKETQGLRTHNFVPKRRKLTQIAELEEELIILKEQSETNDNTIAKLKEELKIQQEQSKTNDNTIAKLRDELDLKQEQSEANDEVIETLRAELEYELVLKQEQSEANDEEIETLRNTKTQLKEALQEIKDKWEYGCWLDELTAFQDVVISAQPST